MRAAIQQANARGANAYTILLPAGTYKLDRRNAVKKDSNGNYQDPEEQGAATGDLDITVFVTIVGDRPGTTVVNGVGADRVFDVLATATVTLMGMTITEGCVGQPSPTQFCPSRDTSSWEGGGGVRNAGTLRLVNVDVRSNQIRSAKEGAGIFNNGPSEQAHAQLAVENSYVVFNSTTHNGGGIANEWGDVTVTKTDVLANVASNQGGQGGGILNGAITATLVVTESVIRENSASYGGGIYTRGPATLTNVTLSENRAEIPRCEGAAIYNQQGTTLVSSTIHRSTFGGCTSPSALYLSDKLILRNTIVAEEAHGCGMNTVNPNAKVESVGYNLDQKDSCQLRGPNDLTNAEPMLESLSLNGGVTRTHRLKPGSKALDWIPAPAGNGSPSNHQRGAPRPFGSGFDIGAFEHASPTITSVDPQA